MCFLMLKAVVVKLDCGGDDMCMLKCHLANDRQNHFVTADEAMSAPRQIWSCASYGCRLALHAGSSSVTRPSLKTTCAQWLNMC